MIRVRTMSLAIVGAAALSAFVGVGSLASLPVQSPASSQASASTSASKATLADVAFIAGTGTGSMSGGVIEEHWAAPAADSMMGMFRYTKGGKAVFYEFLLIEQTATGPVMRLKHFNPGLIGWEEKAEVFSYELVDVQPRRAVFERPDKQTRMTFDGTSGKTLVVILDQMKNGVMQSQTFTYDHVPAGAPSSSR
jgi:hypothetical protein